MRTDRDLADAVFLADHPGWSWDDLQRAPADVVSLIREVDAERAATRAMLAGLQGGPGLAGAGPKV